ncbi:MAG: hypothetical protein C5B52_00340 [Bacteroidetes bacterium]|nr:MAG: hypothetical protein C5B52_00340 [Bacteroidota bacterium]
MRRRSFLILSVMGAAAYSIPFVSCRSRNISWNKTLAQPVFLSHVCDAKTIQEIGNAYRAQVPEESKADDLYDLLTTDSSGKSVASSLDSNQVSAILSENISHEYASGKTINVKGWVLSTTEARQCAYSTLIKP